MPRPKQAVPRYRRRIEVHYGLAGHPPQIGYSGNVSMEGMMLRTPRAMPPGTILEMTLHFPEGKVRLQGRIVWAREGPISWLPTGRIGMGIKFVDPPDELADRLRGGMAMPGTASQAKG